MKLKMMIAMTLFILGATSLHAQSTYNPISYNDVAGNRANFSFTTSAGNVEVMFYCGCPSPKLRDS